MPVKMMMLAPWVLHDIFSQRLIDSQININSPAMWLY